MSCWQSQLAVLAPDAPTYGVGERRDCLLIEPSFTLKPNDCNHTTKTQKSPVMKLPMKD